MRFLLLSKEVATWSKDPSTQVGAIITWDRRIIGTGYNGFPRGLGDDDRLMDRDTKYPRVVHAEINALLLAGSYRAPMGECDLYCTHIPCSACAGPIINAGIRRVHTFKEAFTNGMGSSQKIALEMFRETGVETNVY